jgi:hypothetical protein
MKRLLQIVALLFCIASNCADASGLVHELSVESLPCSGDFSQYPSPDEMKAISTEWLSQTDLKISFWEMETTSYTLRKSGSTATSTAGHIELSLEVDKVLHDPNQPIAMCAWPAHITFAVHGVSRGAYEISIHRGSSSRVTKIDG